MNIHRGLTPNDPPINEAGELDLPDELERLACTLRGDAARIGEAAVPQQTACALMSRKWRASQARRWIWVASSLAVILPACVVLSVVVWNMRTPHPSVDVKMATIPPQSPQHLPAIASTSPQASPDMFLSVRAEAVSSEAVPSAAHDWDGSATPEEKIKLLETALERYRSALEYQQDRLVRVEEELRQAREEISRLRDRRAESREQRAESRKGIGSFAP